MQSKKEFIEEMIKIKDDLTTSDLQGIVLAYAKQNGFDDDELLEEIYGGGVNEKLKTNIQ